MKRVIFFIGVIFLIQTILAINLNVENSETVPVLIKGLENPGIAKVTITNLGEGGHFEFYSLVGFDIAPKGTIAINGGEKKEMTLLFYPRSSLGVSGFYTIPYFIKGATGSLEQKVTFKIIDMKDLFYISADNVYPDSELIKVYLKNLEEVGIEELDLKLSSPFFEYSEKVKISPKETKELIIPINKNEFRKLKAGYYSIIADLTLEGKTTQVQGNIHFAEKNLITTEEDRSGFFVVSTNIKKINTGNTIENAVITTKKNIISRLFTYFNVEPQKVDRSLLGVTYYWDFQLKPGEEFSVEVKTNWFMPFLILVLIAALIYLVYRYNTTDVVVKKKVHFVSAKGGEFGLRVTLKVKARNYVENVRILDRLPPLVKLYSGRFEGQYPSKVEEDRRIIEWNLNKLSEGESRVFSYIIYSKVGILGRFALPIASVFYKREGELREANSNHAFFLAEPLSKKEEEEY